MTALNRILKDSWGEVGSRGIRKKLKSGQKATPPPLTLIQGQEEWEVEKILDLRQRHGKNEYLIRWKGYTQGDNTWEPEDNLQNAGEKLQEYLQSIPQSR